MSKTAIVTGAAMGYERGGPSIGGAIAIQLAKDGYKVVVVDKLKTGERTVEIIKRNKGKAIFVKADVTKTNQVKDLIRTAIDTFGNINCLVNCVARYSQGMAKSVAKISEDEWRKTLNVNLGGYFKCCKYAIPQIIKYGGGTIINISSNAAFFSLPNFSVYSVSKGAINAMTRSIAVDHAPQIRCNAICPGFVRIENSENNRSKNELKKWYKSIAKTYPIKRVCEVEEIANVASFLASEKSSYVNGQCITIDGGRSIADTHEF